MAKRLREDECDLETDSEEESLGFSQKYQLRHDYVKKYKANSSSAGLGVDCNAAPTEIDHGTVCMENNSSSAGLGVDCNAAPAEIDHGTVCMENDSTETFPWDTWVENDDPSMELEDEDPAVCLQRRERMVFKSNELLKWLREHYVDKEILE